MSRFTTFSIFLVCNIAVLSAAPAKDVASPCPDLFKYGSLSTPGKYEATLIVNAHHDLHGVWIRLVFDKPLKELTVADGFEAVKKDKSHDYLVKNPELLLKSGASKTLKLSIEYDGQETPHLVEYRINAVTVCPDTNIKYFLGDKRSEEYLESITTPPRNPKDPNFTCGTVSDPTKISPPWENALFVKINETNEGVCDATLVSDRFFITAAHCVTYLDSRIPIPKEKIQIFFGNPTPHPVSNVIIYPGYNPVNLLNDVALFELEKPVKLSDTIVPICLPSEKSASSKDGIIGGFENVARLGVKAKEITRSQCVDKLPKLKSLLDNAVCAEYSEDLSKGCVGQSGSSFAVPRSGSDKPTYELKGILVAGAALQGKTKCDKGTTVILADTTRYETWIKEHIF